VKRLGLYLLLATIPLAIFGVVLQAERCDYLREDIRGLEKAQAEKAQESKRLIAGIAALRAPDRIAKIAEEDLGLKKQRPVEVLRLRLGAPRATDSGATPAPGRATSGPATGGPASPAAASPAPDAQHTEGNDGN
jgi:cell division protein FtsL